MASISPVSAIDLDILITIQQAPMIPDIAAPYGSINVRFEPENHIAKIINSETGRIIHNAKWEILYL